MKHLLYKLLCAFVIVGLILGIQHLSLNTATGEASSLMGMTNALACGDGHDDDGGGDNSDNDDDDSNSNDDDDSNSNDDDDSNSNDDDDSNSNDDDDSNSNDDDDSNSNDDDDSNSNDDDETVAPPVITPPLEKDEENGEKKEKSITIQNTSTCLFIEKIVVTYLQSSSADNWLLNTDLGGQINTSSNLEGFATDPSFNPMNPCIEFVFNWSPVNDDVPQIWIWDGSNHPILDADKNPILGYSPDWSSTNKIAYVSGGQIWIVSPDGTNQFNTGLYGSEPEWSPDGEVLFFVSLSGMISAVETIDWLHIPTSEVAMGAPVVTADQKMVCGNSNEGCLMLTNENNPGINDQLYGEWTGIAPQPHGDKVLIVNETELEIRPTGETLIAAQGVWFGTTDWYTPEKDEYVPIEGVEPESLIPTRYVKMATAQ